MESPLVKKKNPVKEIIFLIPVFIFTLSIIIARTHVGNMPMSQFFWTNQTDQTDLVDTYCYYKHIAIYFAAGLSVIALIVKKIVDGFEFKKSLIYVPCAIYVLFVLISYQFSDYKYFALHGMNDHYQGVIVLICYMAMVLFIYNIVDSDLSAKLVISVGLIAAFLLGLLGITQATGHDFFQTVAGQKLITPNEMTATGLTTWETIDLYNKFGDSAYEYVFKNGEVYQTVFNINFVPFYLTLLVPIAAMLCIRFMQSENKNYPLSILCLGLFGLYLYNFFAANSASGYLGLAAIVVLGLLVLNKNIIKWIKPLLCLVLVAAIVMGVLSDRWLPEVKSKFSNEGKALLTFTAEKVYADDMPVHFSSKFENGPATIKPTIDAIITGKGHILFAINGDSIVITRNDAEGKFDVTDQAGDRIVLGVKPSAPDVYELLDDRFHDFAYIQFSEVENVKYISVTTLSRKWTFKYDGSDFYYVNYLGRDVSLNVIEHKGFEDNYEFGSWRGAIWAATIPMLGNYLIKGFGPDCYTIAYPQNDYVFAYNNNLSIGDTIIVDKAHNMYMQIWVETGLISLISLLCVVLLYLIGAIKYIGKHGFNDTLDYLNAGILFGIVGFLATGFFNDATVNTFPMFFTMLGTGLAINNRNTWDSSITETDCNIEIGSDKISAMPLM